MVTNLPFFPALLFATFLSLTLVGSGSHDRVAPDGSSKASIGAGTIGPPMASTDSDGDGLPNFLEKSHGSNAYSVDTDGDGFSDTEEFARKTSPYNFGDAPVGLGAKTTMGFLGQYNSKNDTLRVVSVIYDPNGKQSNMDLRLVALMNLAVVNLPDDILNAASTTISTFAAKALPGEVIVISADLPAMALDFFHANGRLSIAGVVKYGGGGVVAADEGYFTQKSMNGHLGTYQWIRNPAGINAPGPASYGIAAPIDGGAVAVANDWTPGEICSQTTAVAATMGPVIVEEVIDAGCEPGWDSSCDPGCPATVGETMTRLDPVVLITG